MKRNRSNILAKVYRDWIKGVLENPNSLYNVAAIELGFEYKPDAVSYPWEMVVQQPNASHWKLDSNAKISEVFDELDGELLILGAPGSGKTTILLDLARTLILRAQQDDTFLIPVIFHLSFWSQNPISFYDWLIYELGERYSLLPQISKKWIENNQILPLLDGLDEVKLEVRSDCIEAINSFRSNYGPLNLVICSRIEDYEVLDRKLKLKGAIVIQPLTQEKINTFLSTSGEQFSALRHVLEVEKDLRELAKIPLMLNIMAMAYRKASVSEISLSNSKSKRNNIFASYVDQMFIRRSRETRYSPEQTILWLTWLANQMSLHNQTIFFIEHLKPDWLKTHQQKAHKWLSNIVLKALLSLTVVLSIASYFGVIWGMILGLYVLIIYKLDSEYEQIKIIGTLSWQWTAVKDNFINVFKGEIYWLLLILFSNFFAIKSLITTLSIGLILMVLSGINGIFISGLIGKDIENEKKTRPNIGIFKSAFYGALVGTARGLFMGFSGILLAIGSNTTVGANLSYTGCFFVWAIFGVITGWLNYGGLTSFQHFTLRLLLWIDKLSPWNYTRFLDYATERVFLYKVGGGYMFIHRLPMDYFASLASGQDSKETGLSSRWGFKYYLLPSFVLLVGLILSLLKLIPSAFEEFYSGNLQSSMNKGEYSEVISNSNLVLKINPRNARVLIYHGMAQNELGNYQQAISDFNVAISLRINKKLNLEALANRGLSHLWLKNYDKALDDLNSVVEQSTSYNINKAQQLINRAFLYNEIGDYKKALFDSNEAIKLNGTKDDLLSAYAWLNRGRAYAGLTNYKQALSDYEKIIKLLNNPETLQNLSISNSLSFLRASTFSYRAYAYSKLENYDKAIEDCNKSINVVTQPSSRMKLKNALAYNTCGFILAVKKDYFGAISYYNKAIEFDPKSGEVFENRGLAYSEIENLALAIPDLETALQLYKIQGKDADSQRVRKTITNLQQ